MKAATNKTKQKTYYELLGVTRAATAEEIKRAYRKKAKSMHPDLHQGGDLKARETAFAEVVIAYDTLKDPKLRREYNFELDHGGTSLNGQPMKWREILAEVHKAMAKDPELRKDVANAFAMLNGNDKMENGKLIKTYRVTITIPLNEIDQQHQRQVTFDERAYTFTIPRGVLNGEVLKYRFIGPNRKQHCLQVKVNVPEVPGVTRNGADLHLHHTIDVWDGLAGERVFIDLPFLAREIDLPTNFVTSESFKFRGRGLPKRDNPDGNGDIYLKLFFRFPPAKPPVYLRKKIEELRKELNDLAA